MWPLYERFFKSIQQINRQHEKKLKFHLLRKGNFQFYPVTYTLRNIWKTRSSVANITKNTTFHNIRRFCQIFLIPF